MKPKALTAYYRFSRPFSSPLRSTFKNVLSISSRTLWNVQFWNIVIQFRALSPVSHFRQLQFKFVGHGIVEHKTAKSISSIGIHFRFTQICLADIRYNAVIIALIESFNRHIYVALIIHKNTRVRYLCVIARQWVQNKGYKLSREKIMNWFEKMTNLIL